MKNEEELEYARKLAEILIAGGLVTSAIVKWSIEGVSVQFAIGKLWIGYTLSRADLAFARPDMLAETLTHKLRKGWEEQSNKTKVYKAQGRS